MTKHQGGDKPLHEATMTQLIHVCIMSSGLKVFMASLETFEENYLLFPALSILLDQQWPNSLFMYNVIRFKSVNGLFTNFLGN